MSFSSNKGPPPLSFHYFLCRRSNFDQSYFHRVNSQYAPVITSPPQELKFYNSASVSLQFCLSLVHLGYYNGFSKSSAFELFRYNRLTASPTLPVLQ
ncbi:hypothetical protein JTE90_010388 [Oedothorax gibbosus]|uniref:Uncharacterized protein n=1 Tax=Oedothorax gibbosus TaxID=931172 RepID=A0AAV6VYB7_9ARAC|nr:hypothetical protein JTE90_010388 [Oedothorax gibbosus]